MKNRRLRLYHIVAVLVSMALVTSSMVSGQYARYSTGDTIDDLAEVASFDVSVSVGAEQRSSDGLTATYPITVSNASEVAVACKSVTLDTSEALATGMTLNLTDANGSILSTECTSDGTTTRFIFKTDYDIPMGSTSVINVMVRQEAGYVHDATAINAKASVRIAQTD